MSKRLTKYCSAYWINLGFSEEESLEKIEQFKLSQRKNKKICKEFWINLGFSEEESIQKVKEFQQEQSNKRKNKFTPSQKEFWINSGFSEEESIQKVKENKEKTNPWKINKWVSKGYSIENAKLKISELQSKNSNKVKTRKNGRTLKEIMKKGVSEEEAINNLKKIQSTNTLEKYQKKYGKEIGEKEWNNRKINWQKKLNQKFSKEQRKKWSSFTYNDYIKKYGKEKADQWLKNKFIKNNNTYSNIQIKLFNEIQKLLNRDFYFGENEYVFKRYKWTYIADFYDDKTKKIIEFYGDFWHGNPNIYNENDICNPWSKEKAKEIWERDNHRIQNLLKHEEVSCILIIWESDFKKNTIEIINKCINFLQNE